MKKIEFIKTENIKNSNNYKYLYILIIVSTIIRALIAGTLEFGNDEVYYRLYALYPDLSHFDHPPMVGWIIQLFSLNLTFDSEFFIRLGSVVIGSINTYLVFYIAKMIKNEKAGLYTALIYSASFYNFIIAGVFILPDTPLTLFWLITLILFLKSIINDTIDSQSKKVLLIAGVTAGLAILSKYHSAFLWFGTILFIIFYRKEWLKTWQLYASLLITGLFTLPIILWNINNDWISFNYHSGRVGLFSSGINFNTFITEISGNFFYNNPIIFVLIIISLIKLPKYFKEFKSEIIFLLFTSIPLIITFWSFSLFKKTLPHWTGPAYINLIIIASIFLEFKYREINIVIPKSIKISIIVLFTVLLLGWSHINYGNIRIDNHNEPHKIGKNDVSLDMYGWRQFQEKFIEIEKMDYSTGEMPANSIIFSFRWFPAANLDYYLKPRKVLALGDLNSIHKYYWINNYRGYVQSGQFGYFITNSRDYRNPLYLKDSFQISPKIDTIPINRNGTKIMNYFIFRLKRI